MLHTCITISALARNAKRFALEQPMVTLKASIAFALLLFVGPRSWAILTGSSSTFAGVYIIAGLALWLVIGLAIGSAMRRLGFKQKDAPK